MIEYPQAGKWWVLVQNWRSSAAGASDDVELELAVLTASDDSSLTVNGPGYHSGGELELQFAWDQPAMLGDEWYIGRSEEHTSELQSRGHLVCRLLLEKKKENNEGA